MITAGIHNGSIFAFINCKSTIIYSSTLRVGTLLSDIPEEERYEIRYSQLQGHILWQLKQFNL